MSAAWLDGTLALDEQASLAPDAPVPGRPERPALVAPRLVGRRSMVTTEGRAMVPHLARLADANDQDFFGVLSPEEHKTLNHILKTLAERRGLHEPPLD